MNKYIVILILSAIAFVNASYLTWESYKIENGTATGNSICDVNTTFSCSTVLKSPYAKIGGVPFPAVAMVVYPVIFLVALAGLNGLFASAFTALLALGIGGICFNSYFIYQEFFQIKVFCPLCLMCTAIIITIAIISFFGMRSVKK